jgi:hypothetical protein
MCSSTTVGVGVLVVVVVVVVVVVGDVVVSYRYVEL